METVFFIGDVALDEYYQADHFPVLKEKILVKTLPAQMGGSIANAACVFRSFGSRPYFLTALNSGEITKRLLAGLNEAGIHTEYMVFDDTLPDSKCLIILAEEEHTVFIPTLGLTRFDITDEAFQELCSCGYLYTNFVEIAPICHRGKKAAEVLSELRKKGVRIFCDLDCAEVGDAEEELFPYVHTAFLNEQGERNLAERFGNGWKEKLFEMGLVTLVTTRAEKGCVIWQEGKAPIEVAGCRVQTVDVTGAGDTFGSSFLHAVMHSEDLRLCAEFANYAAARAVTGMGARYGVLSDMEELREFIRSCGGDPAKYEVFMGKGF